MNRNIRQTLLAPALLLLAAVTLGLAGCTQGEDALQGADGNAGARTLNINVGPKQGFRSGDADSNADTRSTVNESTLAMEWEEGDRIFLTVDYTGVTPSRYHYTMVRTATATWNFYNNYIGTHDENGNAVELSLLSSFSAVPVPLGATGISTLAAQHTDNNTYVGIFDSMLMVAFMDGGSCDQLFQQIKNPAMDAGITLNMVHNAVTRLHFPGGLTPGKKYYVDGAVVIQYVSDGGTGGDMNIPFTAAPDGSLTLCAQINGTGQTVTLKEKDDDADPTNDKVVYSATFDAAYGSSYRCIIPAAGGVNPDSNPDLLKPAPIVPGNTVYVVNGYFVTAPDANESREYQWAASDDATKMDSDPCAGHGDWRMPTMKDFEKMAGWTDINPWSQSVIIDDVEIASDKDAWNAAFPDGYYLSSVVRTSDYYAWNVCSYGNGWGHYVCYGTKTEMRYVRCVQVK